MINRVTGTLAEVVEESVVLERGGIGYEVSVPRFAIGELAARRGREVTLHTMLFVDGNQTGGRLEPVLVGFLCADDKEFFRRFISVKGIGWRKGLRAMSEPVGLVATWIEAGDVKGLKSLSGIGARAAELIVAELKGKLDDLAVGAGARLEETARFTAEQRDALEIMASLGDSRTEAEQWLARAAESNETEATVDGWLRAAYRVKAGVGV